MFKFSQAEETYFTCHHLLLIPPQVKPNLPLRHVSHSISHALMCGESILTASHLISLPTSLRLPPPLSPRCAPVPATPWSLPPCHSTAGPPAAGHPANQVAPWTCPPASVAARPPSRLCGAEKTCRGESGRCELIQVNEGTRWKQQKGAEKVQSEEGRAG